MTNPSKYQDIRLDAYRTAFRFTWTTSASLMAGLIDTAVRQNSGSVPLG
jgi:hypothetical protein